MNTVAQLVLDVLRARAAWQRGTLHMTLREISDLIESRFPEAPCPSQREIERNIAYLVKYRLLQWAKIRDGEVIVIP